MVRRRSAGSAPRGPAARDRRGQTSFYLILVGGCLFVWGVVLVLMFAMGTVAGSEIGVLVNNMTGQVTVYAQPGTYIYNAITSDMYLVDRTEQTLEMTADSSRGDIKGQDSIRVKTRDGSDVTADVTINYRLDPTMALKVINESGPDDAYKLKWVRDYSRSICRNELGKLSTEEFYKAELRTKKAEDTTELLNKLLEPHGIHVTTVQVQSFAFYKEYEDKIKEKKLADQEVEEQKSQAEANREEKKRRVIEREKAKEVEIAKFEGTMQKQVLEAQGEAEKAKKAADAYFYTTTENAKAEYYRRQKEAKAIEVQLASEADGLKQYCAALEGDGGRNLVLLEYARRLKDIVLMGQPYHLQSSVEKVQHMGFVPTRTEKGGDR